MAAAVCSQISFMELNEVYSWKGMHLIVHSLAKIQIIRKPIPKDLRHGFSLESSNDPLETEGNSKTRMWDHVKMVKLVGGKKNWNFPMNIPKLLVPAPLDSGCLLM